MSDTSKGDAVECPICGGTFDPAAAGGWCTNPDCGEWQYDGDGSVDSGENTDDGGAEDTDAAAGDADPTVETDRDASVDSDDGSDGDADRPTGADSDSDPDADDARDADPDPDAAEAPPTDGETAAEAEGTPPVEPTPEPDSELPTDEAAESEATPDPDSTEAAEPAPIECPSCGTELTADANFCIECGADVQAVEPAADDLTECPSCGTDLSGDEHFCANCGEDLDAHRAGDEAADGDGSAADAVDALAAPSEDDSAPIPDSLVLSVLGTDIDVGDGDTVGREVRAALTDAGRPEDEAVRIHREHVRFVREADGFYLVDLGENPTELNDRALAKGDREPVGPGDELELSGVATLTVQSP